MRLSVPFFLVLLSCSFLSFVLSSYMLFFSLAFFHSCFPFFICFFRSLVLSIFLSFCLFLSLVLPFCLPSFLHSFLPSFIPSFQPSFLSFCLAFVPFLRFSAVLCVFPSDVPFFASIKPGKLKQIRYPLINSSWSNVIPSQQGHPPQAKKVCELHP